MKKNELGLIRTEKIAELKERYKFLVSKVEEADEILQEVFYKKIGVPKRIEKLFNDIFKSFPENEFMTKENYVYFCEEIKNMENIFDKANKPIRDFSSDFGEVSYCEFLWLAEDLLEVGTYDNLICPDYPCTSEVICNGKFSYYNSDDNRNEIVVDSFEKCWDYLKESYDNLED